jgi:hypothetical protein
MSTEPQIASMRAWSHDLGEQVRRAWAWMAPSGRKRRSSSEDDDDDDLPRPNAVVVRMRWRPLVQRPTVESC